MWVQIGGCDDNNSMVFARMSPSWVTGSMVKMQIFQRGIGRRRGSWGSSRGRGSHEQVWSYPRASCLTSLVIADHLAMLLKQQVVRDTGENWDKLLNDRFPMVQKWSLPKGLQILNASHSPSLMRQLWESKALQSAPAYLTSDCVLPLLHSDSASMELDAFRALLLIFPTHLSQLLRLGADLRAWCCEWQVVHWSQWQDSRASWTAGWELRLNHNLLRLHFLSWEVWCILSFLCLRYSSSTSQK